MNFKTIVIFIKLLTSVVLLLTFGNLMFECDNNVLVYYKGGRVFSGQKLIKRMRKKLP